MPKYSDRPCARCGKMMLHAYCSQRYCKACAPLVRSDDAIISRAKQRSKRAMSEIARVNGLAQGCGADGLAQRAAHLVRAGELILNRVCLQYGKNVFVRQRNALHAAAEAEIYLHFASFSRRNVVYSIPHGLPGVYIISRADRFIIMEKFVCMRLPSGSSMSLWRQMLSGAPTWSRNIS